MELRGRAASLALLATLLLTALKVGVGIWSGSVGVFSEGIHSFLDLISAAVAFFTVRVAGKPADSEHPYGHGKIETLSSLFEALLLVAAAGWIVYEGVDHILNPHPVEHQGIAIATIAFSMVASYWVYRHNLNAAGQTDSSALHVNALHFLSDVVASAAVLLGLIVMNFTGWALVDPITAFAVAAYILVISAQQVKKALVELTDTQLPTEEIEKIESILSGFNHHSLEAHDIRTRKSGPNRHIDFHLIVCKDMTVSSSHAVCDKIEEKIDAEFTNASVNIHVEPCDHHQHECDRPCDKKKSLLKSPVC